MTGLFSTPKMPSTTTTTTNQAPPTRAASEVQAEVTSDRMRRSAMAGRGSTILTAADAPAGDRRKTLLGE
jgi:hypothetical protein